MTRRKGTYRIRRHAGTRSYMSGVVHFYLGQVKDDDLDLHQARRYLATKLREAGYVADDDEGMDYARHFVISPATERRDLERAKRRAFEARRPDPSCRPTPEASSQQGQRDSR